MDSSWSDEAISLRHIAIDTPQLINRQFIYNHFKTLRLYNCEVSIGHTVYVDDNIILIK